MRTVCLLLLAGLVVAGPLTEGRRGEARKKLLRSRGGNASTEKAVAAALQWLATHQGGSGAWDADGFMAVHDCDCDGKGGGWHGEPVPCRFDPEISALATLAFLGAGHTHKEGPYKDTVARALGWLGRQQGGTLFATAFATRAFAEAYDMTGDETLKATVARGLSVMLESRQPQAAWRYFAGSRMASGVPTTAAVVCALRSAELAGFKVAPEYKREVVAWLDRLVNRETGRVAYTVNGHKLGYTPTTTNAASALLIGAWLDHPRSRTLTSLNLKALAKRRPKWSIRIKRMKVNGKMRDVQIGYLQHYYWQHGTEALARMGGAGWSSWNGALKKALLGKQRKAGHAQGSWDPAGTYGKVGGRVYSTALCALSLEAYYR